MQKMLNKSVQFAKNCITYMPFLMTKDEKLLDHLWLTGIYIISPK